MFSLSSLDPRSKMMIMACISTFAMVISNLIILSVTLLVTIGLLILGKVKVMTLLWQGKTVMVFVAFIFLIQCLSIRRGLVLLDVAGFPMVYWQGFELGAMLSLRLLILVMTALILLTGEARDYLLAMVQCRMPYEIAFMVMVGIHFFPILREEALNVFYCVQLRGTEVRKTSVKRKLQIYLGICIPILVGALERAKSMSMAMEARCFRLYPQRTYLRKLTLSGKDIVILIVFPLLTISMFAVYKF